MILESAKLNNQNERNSQNKNNEKYELEKKENFEKIPLRKQQISTSDSDSSPTSSPKMKAKQFYKYQIKESTSPSSTTSVTTTITTTTKGGTSKQQLHSQMSTSALNNSKRKPDRSTSFHLSHRSSLLDATISSVDDPDSIPDYMSFTYLDILTLAFSICSFVFDLVTDIVVTVFHYINEDYWYFSLTITFIVIPTLIMTIMSFRWYIMDSKDPNSLKVSKTQWFFRIFFLSLQLGPVMRYIDSILYGMKFRNLNESATNKKMARRYFQYMIYEDTDATMLRLFECFLEAAPQLVLQLSIMAIKLPERGNDWTSIMQGISVVASLISLSWCLVTYLRILRLSLPHKQNMTWAGTIVQFLWRFFMLASRVLALSLFASEFTYYISIVCGLHWLIMLLWIVSMKTSFCHNPIEELFYNAILAVIFIFCYFNPVDSPSRKRYIFFYSIMLIENIIILTLWYEACDQERWYRIPAFIVYFASFFIALIFMIIYYLKLHPTQNIRIFKSGGGQIGDAVEEGPSQKEQKPRDSTSPPRTSISSMNEPQPRPSSPKKSLIVAYDEKKQPQFKTEKQIQPERKTSKKQSYKRQFSDVWTTNGRLLHPRPAVPYSPKKSTTKTTVK